MEYNRKRVDVVKIKMCKESSILYQPRKINQPVDAVELIRKMTEESDREKFIVLALNVKNEPQAIEICSIGSLSAAIVHPREVFKMAILANAHTIIIAHNHPSEDTTPSKEDISITKRLKECGSLLGIEVIDHIIVTNKGYMSLKEGGHI